MPMEHRLTSFEEELARGERLIYTNVGVSMRPLLREGRDVMVIEKLSAEPKKYDAVLFRRPGVNGRGRYVLHRILKKNRNGSFWIVGDNCIGGENVMPADILGVMTAVRRGKKTVHTDDLGYRLYVALWCAPWPLRFFLLRAKRVCLYLFGAVKQKVFGK